MRNTFAESVHETAEGLKALYGKNPFDIASSLGIKVIKSYGFKKLCGMYTVVSDTPVIILNGNLKRSTQRAVAAHELGHDRLHRGLTDVRILPDSALYDMTARPEYEANMFAAELLIDDEEIRELCEVYGYDINQTASQLGLDVNLTALKISSMALRGFGLKPDVIDVDNGFIAKTDVEKDKEV